MEKRRFDNEKQAEFEAIMTGLFALEDAESCSFRLASLSEAKEQIRSLIASGEYEAARKVSGKLSRPVKFSLEERSKSFRVQFDEYVKLLYDAMTQQIALSDAVKRYVLIRLESVIKMLAARDGINKLTLSRFEKEVSAWSEVHAEKRKSYSKRQRSEVNMFRSEDYKPEPAEGRYDEYYSPYYLVYGAPPVGALRQQLIDSEIEEHSKILSREVLQQLFGAARTELERSGIDYVTDVGDMFPLVIRRVGEKDLNIEFSYSDSFETNEAFNQLEKRFPDFDNAIMDKIRSLSELPEDERFCHGSGGVVITSVGLKVDQDRVFIGDMPVTEDENMIRDGLLRKLAPRTDVDPLKKQISVALDKNDMIKVDELTWELEKTERRRELLKFSLETILPVIKRTQSVSFRAPDVLVRAWESYANTELRSPIEGKKVEG